MNASVAFLMSYGPPLLRTTYTHFLSDNLNCLVAYVSAVHILRLWNSVNRLQSLVYCTGINLTSKKTMMGPIAFLHSIPKLIPSSNHSASFVKALNHGHHTAFGKVRDDGR